MIVQMQLDLKDVPGSLLRVLEPISSHGGNILSVMHSRGGGDRVLVHIVFKIGDLEMLDLVKNSLKQRNIRATRINIEGRKYYSKKSASFMLVGHVIDTDLRDTIDRINDVGLVSDIDVVMPNPKEKSSVLLEVEFDERKKKQLVDCMKRICDRKKFLLIRSLD
jgi:ACT domain-containing protein